jgi:hypothetical protein
MAGGYAKILSGFVGFRTRDEVFYILVDLVNYKSIMKTGMGRGFLHSIIKLRKYQKKLKWGEVFLNLKM